MFRLLVTVGLVAAINYCNPSLASSAGTNQGGPGCKASLAPTAAEKLLDGAAVTKCIAEQTGLQTTIDGLRGAGSDESIVSSEDDRDSGEHQPDVSDESIESAEDASDHVEHHRDVAGLLEANGDITEATTLRQCNAREKGMLTASDTYDMDKLKANILSKVTGMTVEANTQLGLNGCPAVVEFDVPEYMKCISAYCMTGAAP